MARAVRARPDVCLTMIVRDEARVIERCIASTRPLVSSWAIVDTGSTDGTQELVRGALADLPGALIERPWRDFAHNRSEALDHARALGADYAFVIDADDVLEVDDGFEVPELTAPGYWMEILVGSTRLRRPQLLRLDRPWSYASPIHEYARLPASEGEVRLTGFGRMRCRAVQDGHRRSRPVESARGDLRVLRRALRDDPGNARLMFYTGQTLAQLGRFAEARGWYERCAAASAWEEEAFLAQLQAGRMLARGARSRVRALDALARASRLRPDRAEPLVEVARVANALGLPALAWEHAVRALELEPSSSDVLMVELDAYGFSAHLEAGIAAIGLGDQYAAIEHALAATRDEVVDPARCEDGRFVLREAAMMGAAPSPDALAAAFERMRIAHRFDV